MLKSKNIFVCIGAIHHDYLLNLKKNIINFRSNQITQKSRIGGVAYNIAELLSNFVDVNFYSLAINEACNLVDTFPSNLPKEFSILSLLFVSPYILPSI